jgi:tRNA threonylcarbamoyladenosine biosynthesis protein TsaB
VTILAIDTSHPTGSVSIQTGENEPRSLLFGTASSHLVEMGEAVATLLDASGVGPESIDRVALVIGPGSFTGLRIGLAYTKGLYAALGAEVVTMVSLELLALPVLETHAAVCVMIDARKSEVYAAVYERDPSGSAIHAVTEPHAVAPDKLLTSLKGRPMVFVGSGAVRFRRVIEKVLGASAIFADDPLHQPSTAVLCRVGSVLSPLDKESVSGLEPYYIRPSDAKLSSLRRIQSHGRHQTHTDD